MKREELDTLLQELTKDDLSVDRRLEIFKALQDDKDKSIADIDDLNSKNAKLVDDYKVLEKKRVEDFFNQGKETPNLKGELNTENVLNPENGKDLSLDNILED